MPTIREDGDEQVALIGGISVYFQIIHVFAAFALVVAGVTSAADDEKDQHHYFHFELQAHHNLHRAHL